MRVVDFADLGSLPPEARKAAHILASVNVFAKQIAADADPAGWEEIHLHGRRDILTTCAQRLATVQHRYLPDKPELGRTSPR